MKKGMFKRLGKCLLLSSALVFGSVSLASCDMFFGSDGTAVLNYEMTVDETTGDTTVVVSFVDDSMEDLTFTIPADALDGVGIESIIPTYNAEDSSITLTITYTDSSYQDTVITVPVLKGEDGENGVSVTGVEVGSDENGNTTIQFTYSDETTSELITIPKGIDGVDGVGIADIKASTLPEGMTEITIIYTNEETYKFFLPGVTSIADISYDQSSSTETEYGLIINFTDGTSTTITLPRPQATEWFYGALPPSDTLGSDGDFYLNISNGEIYTKTNGVWAAIFSIQGSGSSASVNRYYVSFVLNDSSESFVDPNPDDNITFSGTSISQRVDEGYVFTLDEIPLVSKEGYTFEGWYTTADNNPNAGKLSDITPVFSNLTLYPRWSQNA